MKKLPILAALFAMGLAMEASAANGVTESFQISRIHVAHAANMHFRVFGMSPMIDDNPEDDEKKGCAGDYESWAYVDEADPGARGKMSVLMAAWLAGKEVKLLYAPVYYYGDSNPEPKVYCHIVEVDVVN